MTWLIHQALNRNYDAALGRFIAPDPVAEVTESMSVYQYANNNPVMMNDPEGNYALPPSGSSQGSASFGISAITSLSQVHQLFDQRLYGGAIEDISYNLMKAYFVDGGTGGGDRTFGWLTTSDGNQMRLAWKQFTEANGIADNTPVNLKGNSSSFYLTWDTADPNAWAGTIGHKKRFTLGAVSSPNLIKGIHVIYESETPTIYRNTLKLIRNGFPYLLHYEPSLAKSNRDALLVNFPAESRHIQRDEYPYASTREGGAGGAVYYVPGWENSLQGGHLSILYATLKPGDAFLVYLVPRGKEPQNELAPSTQPIQISPVVTATGAIGAILTALTWLGRFAL